MALRPVVCRASVQQVIGQQHPLPFRHGRLRAALFRDRPEVAESRREGLMMALDSLGSRSMGFLPTGAFDDDPE